MKHKSESRKRICQDVYRGRQSWRYKAVWQYGPERLQVDIERDAYDFQSHARISVWSRPKMEWSPLADLPMSQANCRSISYVSDGITAADFERDEATLLDRALMVIRGDGAGERPARSTRGPTPPGGGHAPEPWTESGMAIIQDGQGRIVADCDSPDLPDEIHRVNARRIVAAINACEGISTAALEAGAPREIALEARQLLSNAIYRDGEATVLTRDCEALETAIANAIAA